MIAKFKVIIPIVGHYTKFITRRPTFHLMTPLQAQNFQQCRTKTTLRKMNYGVYQTRIIRILFAVVSQD